MNPLRRPFRELDAFLPQPGDYRFLPFRFMRWSGEETLVVNDVGQFLFLPTTVFQEFLERRLAPTTAEYLNLRAKHFLWDGASVAPLELLATQYRTKKSFLDGFTALHIFVVTLRCDHTCRYCQVSRVSENRQRFDMSPATASRAVDLVFRSPAPSLKVEFQGGEPLLAFDSIRSIVEHVEQRNRLEQRQVQFVVATNLSRITDEMLEFFGEHQVLISTSIDGPQELHNANRPNPERNSHQVTVANLRRVREALGQDRVSALMTTTSRSLAYPREIVREYAELGFDAIFVRSVSPYGFAAKTGEAYSYQAAEFVEFYKTALDEVIGVNRDGHALVEVYAQILLRKMLTPFPTGYVDLQSPAGTGIGAVVYNYDGDVYASDESRMLAEMGDKAFRLGNVHEHDYEEIFGGEVLHALVSGSVLETTPGCSDCAFLPYCGSDPIRNYATQGDVVGHRATSGFCVQHMGIIRHLFDLLRSQDPFVRDLLPSWAFGREPVLRRATPIQ